MTMSKIIITQAMFDSWNEDINDVVVRVVHNKESSDQSEWESRITVPGYSSKLEIGSFSFVNEEGSNKLNIGSFAFIQDEVPSKQFALAWKDEFEKYEIDEEFEESILESVYEEDMDKLFDYFLDIPREEQFEFLDEEDNGQSEGELNVMCFKKYNQEGKFFDFWIKDELITLYQNHVLGIEAADD